jgi:hypothetical protein
MGDVRPDQREREEVPTAREIRSIAGSMTPDKWREKKAALLALLARAMGGSWIPAVVQADGRRWRPRDIMAPGVPIESVMPGGNAKRVKTRGAPNAWRIEAATDLAGRLRSSARTDRRV